MLRTSRGAIDPCLLLYGMRKRGLNRQPHSRQKPAIAQRKIPSAVTIITAPFIALFSGDRRKDRRTGDQADDHYDNQADHQPIFPIFHLFSRVWEGAGQHESARVDD